MKEVNEKKSLEDGDDLPLMYVAEPPAPSEVSGQCEVRADAEMLHHQVAEVREVNELCPFVSHRAISVVM